MSQNHQNQWIASFVWMIALAGIAMTASVAQANKNADSPAVNNTNASSGVAAPVKNLTGYANPAGDIPASWLNFGGKPNDVDWKAQWIWMDGPANPRNFYLCARRDFEVPSTKASSQEPWRLHISADSRYRLYVNDEWIGDGPARSFYWAQQYDTYDLADKIKPGETNTIAVLVSHYGEGTFQYNPSGQGGLLVQLEQKKGNQWKPQLITDKSWLVAPHEGYLRPTMRVSCQMPFEEIVDGRLMPFWMASQERLARLEHNGRKQDLSMFRPAKVLGPVGSGPWTTMVGRTVPFFTKDYVKPTRVFKTQLVRMPNFHTGFTTRPYLLPGYFMQNTKELKGFAATIIESPVEQTIRIPQHTWNFEEPIINGEWAGNKKAITLHQGPNLCVIPFRPGKTHEFDRSYCAFIEQPITLKGVFNDETAWTIFGPFGDDYQSIYDRVTKIKTVNELEEFKAKAQVVKAEDILTNGSAWDESTAAE
ncbi:MAG: hypothetical protein FWC56_05655, partial [Phycisphaerae bacterium]|nr:hypothetical protein [Phycisphaerae bacterium]